MWGTGCGPPPHIPNPDPPTPHVGCEVRPEFVVHVCGVRCALAARSSGVNGVIRACVGLLIARAHHIHHLKTPQALILLWFLFIFT